MKKIINIIAIIMMITSCAQTPKEIDGLKVAIEKRVNSTESWKLLVPEHTSLVRTITITRGISDEVYRFAASACMEGALIVFFNHPLSDSLNFRALKNFRGILHNKLIYKHADPGTHPMGVTIRYTDDVKKSFIMINPYISDSFPIAKMGILFHEFYHLLGEINGHCSDCYFMLKDSVHPERISKELDKKGITKYFKLLIERQKQLGDRIHQQ